MQQLLLLPLLTPLLAALLVGALNPRPPVALRVLVWTSPPLPLGLWVAAAAAAGAGISAGASTLALRQGGRSAASPRAQSGRRAAASPGGSPRPQHEAQGRGSPGGGPSRPPGEPAPTVEVPFRVIRRGRSASPPEPQAAPRAAAQAVGDGWDQPLSDSWD